MDSIILCVGLFLDGLLEQSETLSIAVKSFHLNSTFISMIVHQLSRQAMLPESSCVYFSNQSNLRINCGILVKINVREVFQESSSDTAIPRRIFPASREMFYFLP